MAVKQVLADENPILRKKSHPVVEVNKEIIKLLDDMYETMVDYNGIGLAAPQIGVLKRVIVIQVGDELPKIELINPKIENATGEEADLEGCLSVPGVYGEVKRAEEVTVSGVNRVGKNIKFNAKGMLARAIQHEIDHLDGIIFTDKVDKLIEG
ncbi:peptide deformylase [Proteinivorax hydrogeniformans]|uniref:Peptide deformylase n=1 Tax=Proteinivorax hydrogeniformans TaxID=1826727 RepID=A0AAU8HR33_9FIRM